MLIMRSAFRRCGRNVVFDPNSHIGGFENIEIGEDVFIGPGVTILATYKGIIIGNKVIFGPNVTIIGGDHNTSIIGQFMFDVKIKRLEDDQTVIIEDDVWVGARAVICKRVRLGRGCTVAAGAVVTKDVPPYTVVVGVPVTVGSVRFILKHEATLYPPEQRFNRDDLLYLFDDSMKSQNGAFV